MDFREYQEASKRTINQNLTNKEKTFHSLFGMCSEVGELQGIYQKIYQGHDVGIVHMMKEIGDVLWFIAEFCTANHLDMNEIAELNISKLKARYPEGFNENNSLHRKAGDI